MHARASGKEAPMMFTSTMLCKAGAVSFPVNGKEPRSIRQGIYIYICSGHLGNSRRKVKTFKFIQTLVQFQGYWFLLSVKHPSFLCFASKVTFLSRILFIPLEDSTYYVLTYPFGI